MSDFETLGQAIQIYLSSLERMFQTGDPTALESAFGEREERREEYMEDLIALCEGCHGEAHREGT